MSDRTKTTRSRATLLAGPLVTLMCVPALAGPTGEKVVSGKARFNRKGDTTIIRAADNTIINYYSFNIASHETVRFIQPDAQSRVLNRIKGPDPTQINGTLLANGRVYIVNPAGVYFGDGALVNVGALYAAAGNITNRDFLAGRDRFTLTGEVVNEGTLQGDSLALLGQRVENFGTIVGGDGMVAMVAGDEVLIGERDGHVFAKIGADRLKNNGLSIGGVENAGEIVLDGGQIILGAGDMYALVLHDSSNLRAGSVLVEGQGRGTVRVAGSIDATGADGLGGTIHILGERVGLYAADLDASGQFGGGEILVGGDFQGEGSVRNATRTYVDGQTVISADALDSGDGGKVIIWADQATSYSGFISARGAGEGQGGFAEVSGKRSLHFVGDADLGAESGIGGVLLLDPDNITITDGGGGADDGDPDYADGDFLAGDGANANAFISEQFLESFSSAVILQANDNITVSNLTDNVLDLQATTGTVQFIADFDNDGTGSFTMLGANDTISTQGAGILIQGDSVLVRSLNSNGGDITLNAVDGLTIGDFVQVTSINTGGGAFLGNANTDNDITGQFTARPNVTIDTSAGTGGVSILGVDWSLGSGNAINAGAGDVSFNVNTITDVSIGNGSGGAALDATELSFISTTGTFSVGDGGTAPSSIEIEDFDLGGTTNITGPVSFTSQGDVTFAGSASDFSDSLEIIADGSVVVGEDVSAVGTANIIADDDDDNNDGGNPDVFTVGTGAGLTVAGGSISIDASDIEIGAGGTLTAMDVSITRDAGGTFRLGGLGAGDDLELEQTELDGINATNLTIGGDAVTAITIDGVTLPSVTGLVTINAGGPAGAISFVNAATTFPDALTMIARANITLDADVTTAGATMLEVAQRDGGNNLIGGGTLTINDDNTLATGGNDLDILADDIVLGTGGAAQRIDTGAGDLSLTHWQTTGIIDLGTDQGGNLVLDAAELAKITATNMTVGRSTGETVAQIRVNGATTPNVSGLITLNALSAGGTVSFSGGASTLAGGLSVFGASGVSVGSALTTGGTTVFDAAGNTITLNNGAAIDSSGSNLTFNDDVQLADGASASAASSGGDLLFSGEVFGTDGGTVESLTLDAGAGMLTFADLLSGNGTAASGTGLANVTITNAGATSTQGIEISGLLDSTNALTGAFTTNGNSITVGSMNLSGTDFTFEALTSNGAVGPNGDVTINNSGLLTVLDTFNVAGNFSQTGPGNVDLGADIVTSSVGGDQAFSGAVTVSNSNREFAAGTGGITIGSTLDGGVFDLTFTGNRVDLVGGVDSVTGTGGVIIRPDSATTDIDVGNVTGAGGTAGSGLRFGVGDLAALDSTFNSVTFGYGGTGAHTIQVGNGAGYEFATFFEAPSGVISLLGFPTASGSGSFTFNGSTVIADGANPFISTDGGFVTFNGTLSGTAGGTGETLRLTLNGGDLTFAGLTSSAGGAVDATGLAAITLTDVGAVSTQGIAISGLFSSTSTLAGDFTTNGNDIEVGSLQISGGNFDFAALTSNGLVGPNGNVTINNSGLLDINGGFTVAGDFGQTGVGTVDLGGDIDTSSVGGDVAFVGAVTVTDGNREFLAGTGGITIGSTLDSDGFDMTFTGNRVDLSGGADSVTGGGDVIIRPATDSTDIDVGNVTGAGGTAGSGLRFGVGDLGALDSTFNSVTFGYAGTGTHTIQIGNGAGYEFATIFEAPGGTINLLGFPTASGLGSFTFNGPAVVADGANPLITTAGGFVLFNDTLSGTVGGAGETIRFSLGGGDLTFAGQVSSAGGVSDATGLAAITLTSVGAVSTQGINISGLFSSTNALTGNFATNGNDLEVGSFNVSGTTFDFAGLTSNGLVGPNGNVTINNSGLLDINGGFNVAGDFSQSGAGAVQLGGDVDTSASGGDIAFAGAVTVTDSDRELNAGTGGIDIASTFAAGAFNAIFTGNRVDLTGGAGSVTGTGDLVIRPADDTTDLDIGNLAPAGATPGSGLRFGIGDFAAIGSTFNSLTFGYAGSGSHQIQVGFTGDYTNPTTFASPLGTTSLFASLTASGNGSFAFPGHVRIGEGQVVTITTGGTDLTFSGPLDGTTGGAGERLNLVLGGGDLTFLGGIFGDLGTMMADSTGLQGLSLTSANNVTTQQVAISGSLRSEDRLTGDFTTNAFDIEVGNIDLTGQSFTFAGVTTTGTDSGNGNFDIDNAGTLTLDGDLMLAGNFNQTDALGTGDVLIGGDITTGGSAADGILFTSMVQLTGGPLVFDAGDGTISFLNMLDLFGFPLDLIAGDVNFAGGAGSIKDTSGSGLGALTLAPNDPTDAIDVGNVSAPQAGAFSLSNTDLAALSGAGLGTITIGRADGMHMNFVIENAVFGFDAIFRSPLGGAMSILGTVTNTLADAGTVFDNQAISLGGNIGTNNGAVQFTGPITLTGNSQVVTTGGNINVDSTVDGAFDLTMIALTGNAGTIVVGDVIGASTALNSLALVGFDVLLNGIGTGGSAGVTNATVVNAGDDIIFRGGIYNANNQIYLAEDENRMNVGPAVSFFSNGSDITFGTAPFGTGADTDGFAGIVLFNNVGMSVDTGGGDLTVNTGIRNSFTGSASAALIFDAGTGSITVAGPIGADDGVISTDERVGSVDFDASSITVNGVISRFGQSYTADAITLAGDFFSTDSGVIDFRQIAIGGVTDITLAGDTNILTAGGAGDNIEVFGGFDGNFALMLDAGLGNTTIRQAIGVNDALASFSAAGNDVTINNIGTGAAEGVLGDTTITALDDVRFIGTSYNANAQSYSAGDELRIINTSVFTSSGDDIAFGGAGFVRLQTGNTLSVFSNGGDVTFSAEVTGDSGAENFAVNSGTGTGTFFTLGANSDGSDPVSRTLQTISLTGDEVDLTGNVFGDVITIAASTIDLPIAIGSNTLLVNQLDLTQAEIDFLRDGFTAINLGTPGGMNAFTISDVTFIDPVFFTSSGAGGVFNVNGILRGNDNATIRFNGSGSGTFLRSDILTEGNEVFVDDNIFVEADSTVDTDGGNIETTGTVDGPAGLSLLAFDGVDRGTVVIGDAIGTMSPLSSLTITGYDVRIRDIGTDSDQGVTGLTDIEAFDDLIYNGGIVNASELDLRAGDEHRVLVQNSVFRSNGADISFGLNTVGLGGDSDGFVGILLQEGVNLSLFSDGGNISTGDLVRSTAGVGTAAVLFDAGTGTITVDGNIGDSSDADRSPGSFTAIGSMMDFRSVSTNTFQSYTGTAGFNGTLTSFDSGSIMIDGDMILNDDVTVLTAGNADDDFIVTGGVDDSDAEAHSLTIDVGSDGDVSIAGPSGQSERLGSVQITEARNITFGRTSATSLDILQANGLTTFTDDFDTNTSTGISFFGQDILADGQLRATDDGGVSLVGDDLTLNGGVQSSSGNIDIDGNIISIGGNVTTTEEGDITISNTGLLTIQTGTIFDLTGNFTQDSTSPVRFNASNLEARRNTILFQGAVTLGADALFRALNVTFERAIDGATAGGQSLTVRGDGTLVFDRSIGAGTALRDISIRATGSGDAAFSAIGGDVIGTGDQVFVGQTRLLADGQMIEAGGSSSFMGDVRVTGMTHIRSGGDMTFMGAIDGAGGAGASEGMLDLALTTDLPILDTSMDIVDIVDAILAMPVVRIMGSVGDTAGLKPLAGLMINVVDGTRASFDGNDLELTSIPAAPTIIFGEPGASGEAIPDFNINADFFEAGLFEKVTVYGNANFNVDTLTLGDANILGTLNSTATTLNLLARPQSFVLIGFDDTPSRPNKYLYGPQVDISRDLGSDIVVAGVTTEVVNGTPTDVIRTEDLINMPNLTTVNVVEAEVMVGGDMVNLGGFALFSAPEGRASVAGDTADALEGVTIIQPIEDDFLIDRSKFFTDDNVDNEDIIVNLDLIGRGIGSDNPAVARALAVAASSELGDLPDDTTVGTVNDEAAEALGLNLQDADPSTLIDSIVGFALYNDGANTGEEAPGDARITRNRLDFGLVDEVIDEYYRLFWRPALDENGDPIIDENGEVVLEQRLEEIQDAIAAAADDYQATSGDPGFDPRNFNRFVEFSPEHTNASAYLAQLRRLLDTVELLGLSPRELRISRDKILSYARPQFMTEAEFESIVNFDPSDLAAPGLTPEAGE